MTKPHFEPDAKMSIDIQAAFAAHDQNPGFEGRLIDIITDEHIKIGIRHYFADEPTWDEDLMPEALAAYHESARLERIAVEAVQVMMAHFFGRFS